MPFLNDVKFTASTSGLADFGIGAVRPGFQLPSTAGAVNGQSYSWTARTATQFESFKGNYNASLNTIERTEILDTSAGFGVKVNFSSVPVVGLTALADDLDFAAATIAEDTRSPIDGTELVRLATVGAGWKSTLTAIKNWLLSFTRQTLTADRTYYVRKDGSDSNSGLINNAGGAFLTIQHAVDVVCQTLDVAGFIVTIQVVTGTYTEEIILSDVFGVQFPPESKLFAFTYGMRLVGDESTPSNVHITINNSVNWAVVTVAGPQAFWNVSGFKLSNSGSFACHITATNNSLVNIGNMEFGDNGSSGQGRIINALNNSFVICYADKITKSGTAGYVMFNANDASVIDFEPGEFEVLDAPNFTEAFIALYRSAFVWYNSTDPIGSLTGQKWVAYSGSVIIDYTGDIPGDVDGYTESTSFYNYGQGVVAKSGPPIAGDLAPQTWAVFKDTSGGGVVVAVNDGGVVITTPIPGGGGGTAAGSDNEIQLNDDGALGSSPLFFFNPVTGRFGVGDVANSGAQYFDWKPADGYLYIQKMNIAIQRDGTTVIELNSFNGITLSNGRRLSFTPIAIGSLPGSPSAGDVLAVNDANSPTIGSTVASGGSAYALVNFNGAAWKVIGV